MPALLHRGGAQPVPQASSQAPTAVPTAGCQPPALQTARGEGVGLELMLGPVYRRVCTASNMTSILVNVECAWDGLG